MNYQPQSDQEQPISVGQWMLNLFLTYIPFVNFILLIIWAVSNTEPKSKVNWARAKLLWMCIGVFFGIIFYGAIIAFVLGSGFFTDY